MEQGLLSVVKYRVLHETPSFAVVVLLVGGVNRVLGCVVVVGRGLVVVVVVVGGVVFTVLLFLYTFTRTFFINGLLVTRFVKSKAA